MNKIHLPPIGIPHYLRELNKHGISNVDITKIDDHVHAKFYYGSEVLTGVSFYENNHTIMFNIIDHDDIVIKYTDDIGVLNASVINNYINKYKNFFTKIYLLQEVDIEDHYLPLYPINEDGIENLAQRFKDYKEETHYIEVIEKVDGTLANYPYEVTTENLSTWFEQLWNMYSFLHNFNFIYDDIKPYNIGYKLDGDKVSIKMVDLESLRRIDTNYAITPKHSGIIKTREYYTFSEHLYDSVDILSMIFAMFNAYCNHNFKFCDQTLSELTKHDCTEIEKHFFNMSDNVYCSNYKFLFIIYALLTMTEMNNEITVDNVKNYLESIDCPSPIALIIANLCLYIYMKGNSMLTFINIYEAKNPINLQTMFNNYKVNKTSIIGKEQSEKERNNCMKNVIENLSDNSIWVFENYKEFINKSLDAGTFKYVAKMLYN